MNRSRVLHVVFSLAGGAGSVVKTVQQYQKFYFEIVEILYVTIKNNIFDKIKHPIIFSLSLVDNFLIRKSRSKFFFSILRSKLSYITLRKVQNYDFIHLHWTPGIMHLNSKKIIKAKKIFIHLHDMWFLTGGCHYAGECEQYINGCKDCPQVKKIFKNMIKQQAIEKRDFININNAIIVAPSKKFLNLAEKSFITKKADVIYLPNPSSKTRYGNLSKVEARRKLKISDNYFIIGFIAMNLNEKRKNINEFYNLISLLTDNSNLYNVKGLTCGNGKVLDLNQTIINLGFADDELKKYYFYKAIDVLLVPSLEENLPVSVQDSIKYGVPTVINILSAGNEKDFGQSGVYYYENFEDLSYLFSNNFVDQIKSNKMNANFDNDAINTELVEKLNTLYFDDKKS